MNRDVQATYPCAKGQAGTSSSPCGSLCAWATKPKIRKHVLLGCRPSSFPNNSTAQGLSVFVSPSLALSPHVFRHAGWCAIVFPAAVGTHWLLCPQARAATGSSSILKWVSFPLPPPLFGLPHRMRQPPRPPRASFHCPRGPWCPRATTAPFPFCPYYPLPHLPNRTNEFQQPNTPTPSGKRTLPTHSPPPPPPPPPPLPPPHPTPTHPPTHPTQPYLSRSHAAHTHDDPGPGGHHHHPARRPPSDRPRPIQPGMRGRGDADVHPGGRHRQADRLHGLL